MKLIVFLLVILFSLTSVYAQTMEKLDKSIDSLKVIKTDFESQKKILETNIIEIDKLIEILIEKKTKLAFKNVDYEYPAIVKVGGFLLSKETITSEKLLTFSAQDTVGLLSFNGGTFYKVIYRDKIGYLSKIAIERDPSFDKIDKLLNDIYKQEQAQKDAEKAAKNERQKEIAAQKRAIVAEKRKSTILAKYGQVDGQNILDGKIWVGMTKEMALESWGKPENINRTVNANSVREQWVYGLGTYLYFDDGILTTWQD
jgi:hypothetical protein